MSYHWITHETYGRVLFNTDTQGFIVMPDTANKIALNGKLFDYFESLREFIESESKAAIILFFCSKREVVGKRYKVTLNTMTEAIEFWNVEKTSVGWVRHESDRSDSSAPATGIEVCYTGSAYLLYLIKESDCLNGCRVKSVKKVDGKG